MSSLLVYPFLNNIEPLDSSHKPNGLRYVEYDLISRSLREVLYFDINWSSVGVVGAMVVSIRATVNDNIIDRACVKVEPCFRLIFELD